ncbi:MAG: HAD family hydrolase [Chloroflexota bacterium]
MTNIKLVAVDLDGTLLASDSLLAQKGSRLLMKIAQLGVHVVICTTRNPDSAVAIADQLGLSDPLICSNGGQIWASPDGPIWIKYTIPIEVARSIAEVADANDWEMLTTIDNQTYARARRDQAPIFRAKWGMVPTNLTAITDDPIRMLVHQPEAIVHLRELVQTDFADQARTETYYRPDGSLNSLGIFPIQADKGTALRYVLDRLGIVPEQTMTIGDNPNDVPMIQTAGIGIAMGNAPKSVKQEATAIAPTNDDEGVAWAIKKYVLDAQI